MFASKPDSLETKDRILLLAEEEFALKGFAGARLKETARRAGVTKTMIHYYFDSKENLFHSVLDHVFSDILKVVDEVLSTPRSFTEGLEFFYRGFFDFVVRHKNFSQLVTQVSNDDYFIKKVTQFFTPLFKRSVRFIEEGIEAGAFRRIDASQFLLAMYSMTISYFSDARFLEILTDEDTTSEERIAQRLDCLLDVLLTTLGIANVPKIHSRNSK